MKKLFICALAVGMFTACSQDETISQQSPMQISFDGAFVENATRAAEDPSITTASIKNFSVWGYVKNANGTGQVFNDVTVTKTGNAWTYSPLQYWTPSNEYHFFALTTNKDTDYKGQVTDQDLAESGIGEIKFTITDGNEDLLYATATAETPGTIKEAPAPVKFVFDHLLSKVKFTFKNGFATGYSTIKVTDIKMTVPAVGTIALNEQGTYEWKTAGETAEISEDNNGSITLGYGNIEKGNSIAESAKGESDNERLVIPADETQSYNVTFDVELFQDNVSVYKVNDQAVTISNYALQPGYAYNFIATLDPTNIGGDGLHPIEFEAVVEDWVENGLGILGHKDVTNEAELVAAIEEGAVINLVEDITLKEVTNISKDVILNLNGKTLKGGKLSGEASTGAEFSALTIIDGANLTIYGDGTIVGGEYGVYAKNGNLTIKGGKFEAVSSAVQVWVGEVTIEGGNFSNTDADKRYLINCIDANYKDGTAKVAIKGGTFVGFDPANNKAEGAGTNFVATDYESVENGDYFIVQKVAEEE